MCIRDSVNTFNFRQRLLATNGTFANQVMFRAAEGNAANQMRPVAQATLANWMDRIAADHSDRSQAEKVIADKPADAVDACWTPAGTCVNEPAVVNGTGTCADLYSPHRLPDQAAGKPIGSIVIKCQLKPVVASDYGSPGPNQLARLRAIFPGGVCDYSKPGVGQQPLGGTWRNYGPKRADPRGRKLKLEVKKAGGKGKGARGKDRRPESRLVAKLKPCPEANRQKVVFERRANGEWRRLGAAYSEGGSCKATLEARLGGAKKVRATAAAGSGYDGARDTARAG